METLIARLTPWATKRVIETYGGITKKSIKQSLADFPRTEFWTMATPTQRAGRCFTVAEVPATHVEVYNVVVRKGIVATFLVATISVHPSGQAVVL